MKSPLISYAYGLSVSEVKHYDVKSNLGVTIIVMRNFSLNSDQWKFHCSHLLNLLFSP